MPKKQSNDAKGVKASPATDTIASSVKKTERSHEENQERAYIAASRRSDRSIEARLQSARMASEIHKKRTGKGFRITEEIVRREEMYEEEEDDLPRSYRMLNPNMQTDSAEFNAKIEAWMTSKMAMSVFMQRANDEWQNNAINRMFEQSFPQARQQAQQVSRQISLSGPSYGGPQPPQYAPQQQQQPTPQSPPVHSPLPQSPLSPSYHQQRNDSISVMSSQMGNHKASFASSGVAPDVMSPSLTNISTPSTPAAPQPALFGQEQSAFSTELPNEMKLMMTDMNPQYSQNMFDQSWSNMGNADSAFFPMDTALSSQQGLDKFGETSEAHGDLFNESFQFNPDEEISWDTFLNNDTEWSTEQ